MVTLYRKCTRTLTFESFCKTMLILIKKRKKKRKH
jgi:hypothetical protein